MENDIPEFKEVIYDEVYERKRLVDIEKLNESINELNESWHSLNMLLESQQENIDLIDKNANITEKHITNATEEIIVAKKISSDNTKLKYSIVFGLVLANAPVAIIFGGTIGAITATTTFLASSYYL